MKPKVNYYFDLTRSFYRNSYISTKEKILNYQSASQFSGLWNHKNPLFIVGIPNSLHIIKLCLKYIPTNINTVLIANGLSEWENDWVKDSLNIKQIIELKFCARHGTILDMLIDHLNVPFTILDYDCFVFNPELFYKIQPINILSICNGVFKYSNPNLSLTFPETFLMNINTEVIKQIKKKYHVSCNQYRYGLLSSKVKQQVLRIGIDGTHLPEHNKKVFDTLRLILSLGYSEGLRSNFIENYSYNDYPTSELFHVGGTSLPNYLQGWHQWRGSYFWRRALEVSKDRTLQAHYRNIFGRLRASDLLDQFPGFVKKAGEDFFDLVEKIVT